MAESARRSRWRRLAILGGVLAGALVIGQLTGVTERFDAEALRQLVRDAGAWGVGLFVVSFAVGEFLHVPGLVFIAAAVLAWGPWVGYAVGLLGAVVSVCVSFALVRGVGGNALAELDSAFLRRMLGRLDERPVRTVILLRLLLFLLPAVNYALALTSIRFRDYLLGSALGLAAPLGVASYLLGFVL